MDEHELASRVVEMVDEVAYQRHIQRVKRLHLELGGRRTIDLDRLREDFRRSARGTVAEEAELCVRVLPVHRRCRGCAQTFEAPAETQHASGANTGPAGTPDLPCPTCGHPHTEAIDGDEVRLMDMEVDVLDVSA